MHKLVSFNRQILSASETNLSPISSAVLYGKGVFTTIAIYNSKPFLWEQHWLRLTDNAEKLEIDLADFSKASIENSLTEIIKKNSVIKGRARLTFLDQRSNKIWPLNSENKTSSLITTADFRETSEKKIALSPFSVNSVSPLINVKSCNYLENVLAFEKAQKSGFDEAIRLNERSEIVSACLANIFWLKNKQIFTPSLETGCLAGTTRNLIIKNFSVTEVSVGLDNLEGVDGIFLTSAGIEVTNVRMFGKTTFKYSDSLFQIKDFFNDFVTKH